MRRARAFALLTALAVAAAACIPDLSGEDDAGVGPTPDPAARAGGSITVSIPAPDGIDPGAVHEPSGALVVSTLCDTLVAFDPRTGEPVPGLAESWTVTRGGRRLFVKLRAGARFTNGRTVTADDVAYSLSRLASQEFASRSARLLAPVAGFGFVSGELDTDNPRLRRELIGVGASDARTVEIALDEPRADFIRVLGHPATAPVPREEVEADPDAFTARPVCAGPYALAEPWSGGPIRLARADTYHGRNAAFTAGGAGYADRITFLPARTPAAGLRAYRSGRTDVARAPAGGRAPGARVVRAPGGRVTFVGLPTSTAPFDRAAVRRALSLALDRTALVRRLGPAALQPATSFLPPGAVSEEPDACGPFLSPRADRGRARALLREAGVDLARARFTIWTNEGFGNRALTGEVARQWRAALGARVDTEATTYDAYLRRGRSRDGFTGPFRFSWEASPPGAEAFLVPLFDDSGIGIDNFSRVDSAAFADALDAFRRATDAAERADAARVLREVLCVEMPMIPLAVDVRAFAVRPRIGSAIGAFLDAAGADPIVRELYVRTPG